MCGVKGKPAEFSVSDKTGVWKTRTVKREPVAERWAPDGANMVIGVPWKTRENDPNTDGEPPMVIVWPERDEEERRNRVGSVKAVPRRPQLKKENFNDHGYSPVVSWS